MSEMLDGGFDVFCCSDREIWWMWLERHVKRSFVESAVGKEERHSKLMRALSEIFVEGGHL